MNILPAVLLFLLSLGNTLLAKDSLLIHILLTDNLGHRLPMGEITLTTFPNQKAYKLSCDTSGQAYIKINPSGISHCEFQLNYRNDHYIFGKRYSISKTYPQKELFVKLKYEPKYILLPEIFFEKGSDLPHKSSYREINDVKEMMFLRPEMNVEIVGHCHEYNLEPENKDLSLRRANAVKKELLKYGIQSDRITTTGAGSSIPLYYGEGSDLQQKNSRIEVRVLFSQ